MQFGKVVRMDKTPGLHFKIPFIQNVEYFDRRIELLFEVNKADLKSHLMSVMDYSWKDNQKAWILGSDMKYAKPKSKSAPFSFQNYLLKLYGA